MVCTGNICRSPMAEVVLRHLVEAEPMADGFLVDRVQLSSAGTGPWHEGESMDPRAAAALAAAGYLDHGHIAHQFDAAQVDPGRADRLDLLVAMDRRHQQTLRSLTAGRFPDDRIVMLRSFDRRAGGAVDVADPYYGSEADFAACLAIVEAGCRGLVRALAASLAIPAG
ncbi:MAG TPA: low molecular weight protein-tyrosine-phosphatase [Acidimicrobiales bacterium]|nr:low molecular weight protein-tyrosine-phosphatase [Acidimicrobiales bacterium]